MTVNVPADTTLPSPPPIEPHNPEVSGLVAAPPNVPLVVSVVPERIDILLPFVRGTTEHRMNEGLIVAEYATDFEVGDGALRFTIAVPDTAIRPGTAPDPGGLGVPVLLGAMLRREILETLILGSGPGAEMPADPTDDLSAEQTQQTPSVSPPPAPFTPSSATREACARAAHEANRAYCLSIGDVSQPAWEDAPAWQKDSARAGVELSLNWGSPAESHASWLEHKRAEGWSYGPVKDPALKQHPCFVPYAQLPIEQQAKDALYGQVVRAVASARGELPPAPVGWTGR